MSMLSGTADASNGERAVMLTLWATTKDPDAFDKYTSRRTIHW
jgi:hypothetical protein